MEKVKVELCMGSSCFARGNSQALMLLESYIHEHGLDDQVELEGHLCLNACSEGPNLSIDGTKYQHVESDVVVDLLEKALATKRGNA